MTSITAIECCREVILAGNGGGGFSVVGVIVMIFVWLMIGTKKQ